MKPTGKQGRRLLNGALAGVVSVLMSAAPASAAGSATSDQAGEVSVPGSSAVQDFIDAKGSALLSNQGDLEAFKTWVITRPGIGKSGYIESVNHAATRATTLLWYGDSPLAGELVAEGARRGITVSVEHRQHSIQQIDAAIAATRASASQAQWQGFKISYIAGVTADYDGIVVHGSYPAGSSVSRQSVPASVAQAATATAGMPVRVVAADDAHPAAATRANDFAPFNSGGYILSPSLGRVCTTGFSIKISGVAHTTTARHCTANDYQARDGSAKYGTGVLNTAASGARVLSAAGSALMFDGAYNDSTGLKRTVAGFVDLSINDLICTSGGNSGAHCNIMVDNLSVSWDDGYGSFWTIHGTQQTAGDIAVIQGDSGGPVFTVAGTGRVYAAGMIQAVDHPVTDCGPVRDGGDNMCGTGFLFSSTRTIVNEIAGGSLVVG